MLAADLAQPLKIAAWRHDDTGRALHRLDNDCRNGGGIVQSHQSFKIISEMGTPAWLTVAVSHLCRIPGVWQVVDAGDHQRCKHLSVGHDPADRNAPESHTVIATFASDDPRPRRQIG